MYRMNLNVLSLVKKLEIALKILVETGISSRYRSIFKGKGLEFEDYRTYGPGDDAKMIDWKASARANQTLIKQFKEERNLDVYFLFDVSNSMVFGSTEKLKNEYAAELVAALGHFILKIGDNVGLLMFNDRVVHVLPSGGGTAQFYLLLRSLVNPEVYGGSYNLSQGIDFVSKLVRKKSLLFIVSDFIGVEDGWYDSVKLATAKFDIIGIMIRDPRDRQLPKGVGHVVISDPYTNKTMLIYPDEVGSDYERYAKVDEKQVRKGFLNNNADFIEITTEQPFVKPLINFFKRREILLST